MCEIESLAVRLEPKLANFQDALLSLAQQIIF